VRRLVVNVEIKNWPRDPDHDPSLLLADAVAPVVAPMGERAIVSSFNIADVDRVRALDPSIPTGTLATFGPDATWPAASSTGPAAGATAPCTPTTPR
jgi:glycerophosphoryl diester phosphodiesterase